MVQSLGGKLAEMGAAAPVHDNATAMNRLGEPVDVANLVLSSPRTKAASSTARSHVIDDGASVIAGSTVARGNPSLRCCTHLPLPRSGEAGWG